jgi:hypothetical protein
MLVLYRVSLACAIAFAAFRAWRHRSTISLIFAATCFQMLVHGHWGQTTELGAAVIGGGLTLAAAAALKTGSSKAAAAELQPA